MKVPSVCVKSEKGRLQVRGGRLGPVPGRKIK